MKNLFLLLSIGLFVSCQDGAVEPNNEPSLRMLSAEESQVVEGANDFAFHLFRKIQKEVPGNQFISPLSVSMALAMALNGAADETKQSILNTIDFGAFSSEEVNKAYQDLTTLLLATDRKVELGIANSIWYDKDYTIYPDFASLIQDRYSGEVKSLDFTSSDAKNKINQWVEKKTNNRIKNLIEGISPDEVLFLINAIYFKGDWTYKFDKSKTHKASFTTADNTLTSVDMMFSKGVTLDYFINDSLQVLTIPYGNKQFNFTVVMPREAGKLNTIVKNINAEKLAAWQNSSDSLTVELELPRFKMGGRLELLKTLESMGMQTEGFTKLLQERSDLSISKIIHQTFLEVNEEGSEAAAATAIGIRALSYPSTPPRITIDRPFIFMIREKHSGSILFLGQLINPEQSE